MVDTLPQKTLEVVSRVGLVVLARLISGAGARWINCQPDTNQRIYFANHTSHLDALVIWSLLPPQCRSVTRPVAAKDYWEKGRIKPYLAKHVFSALLIDRQNIRVHQSPVDLMLREIGDKDSLIVFPEGHRNTGTDIDEFKSGLYYMAKNGPTWSWCRCTSTTSTACCRAANFCRCPC